MKAMTIHEYGDPDVFRQEDLPIPEPASGEVQVLVRAVSINPVDTLWRRNGPFRTFPVVLGWDVSGVVTALGEGVSEFQVGDEVYGMVRFPQEGRAYAEYVAAPVTDLALKPPTLSHPEAAAMTLAALTALQALDRMGLQAGQRILIHAAAGGVGHFAVQLAKARGATVIGTASAPNHDFVRGLGADEVVDYHAAPFETQIGPVDAVFDCVGGETRERSYALVRPGGWLVSIVGPVDSGAGPQHGIHAENLLVRPSGTDLRTLSALVQAGQLQPHVRQRFPLEAVAEAHRAVETRRTVGKIVLNVGG